MNVITDIKASQLWPAEDGRARIDQLATRISASTTASELFTRLDLPVADYVLLGYSSVVVLSPSELMIYRRLMRPTAPTLSQQALTPDKRIHSISQLVPGFEQRKRLSICSSCPHNVSGICSTITLDDGTEEPGCGCTIAEKARLADEACPLSKWSAYPSRQTWR